MDETLQKGGPAFPVQHAAIWQHHGMTLRQYAAIKLRVPNSGTDWLDEMIRTSLRDEFAAKAIVAIETRGDNGGRDPSGFLGDGATGSDESALVSYWIADAMLAARGEEK